MYLSVVLHSLKNKLDKMNTSSRYGGKRETGKISKENNVDNKNIEKQSSSNADE